MQTTEGPAPFVRHTATRVRNRFAFLSLICGICAWVPLVILVAAPLAVLFALLAFATGRGGGLAPARAGLILTAVAVALHATVLTTAGALGWVAALFGG